MDTFYSQKEREKMILENQALVYYFVKKINPRRDIFEDFVSVGTIGLIKAVETYDQEKEIRFATYASRCIKNEIFMYMRQEKKYLLTVSLDTPLNSSVDGGELTVEDVLTLPGDFTEDVVTKQLFVDLINIVLNCLSSKERLMALYSFANVNQQTIATELNFSQSYVSRAEKRIHKKIQSFLYSKISYKEVFTMCIEGETYKISFSSKDVKQFNKVLASVLQNTKNAEMLPDFKVVSEEEIINIIIPAHVEAFRFIARIIQEIDNYTISFAQNKHIN